MKSQPKTVIQTLLQRQRQREQAKRFKTSI